MLVLGVLALTASGYTVGPVAQVHRRPVVGGAPLAPAGFRVERSPERGELVTSSGWRVYASANSERLVVGCINADFCKQTFF